MSGLRNLLKDAKTMQNGIDVRIAMVDDCNKKQQKELDKLVMYRITELIKLEKLNEINTQKIICYYFGEKTIKDNPFNENNKKSYQILLKDIFQLLDGLFELMDYEHFNGYVDLSMICLKYEKVIRLSKFDLLSFGIQPSSFFKLCTSYRKIANLQKCLGGNILDIQISELFHDNSNMVKGRISNLCKRAHINTVEELLKFSKKELLAMRGMGNGSMKLIEEKLSQYGLELQG